MPNLDIVRRSSRSEPAAKRQIQKPPPLTRFEWPRFTFPQIPWKIVLAVVLAILILGAGIFIFLPSATITVKARSEPVARDFEIRVDQKQSTPSSADLAVGAKIIEQEVAGSKKFAATATRNAGKTASGFVLIYNFSKTTLILKAETTTLAVNGRQYYFTQDVSNIRPTARIGLEDEEIDETSLVPPVPLVAAGPGEEYNLPAGTRLEIRNEAFGAQPKLLYAVVGEDVSGGSTKLVKLVAQNDIDSAFAALSGELVDQARAKLASENPDIRILDNAIDTQTAAQQSEYPAGKEAEEFAVSMTVKIRALTYDETDVRNIIFERIRRLLPEEKKLSEDTATLDALFASVNLNEGHGSLRAHFEGTVVYELDRAELLEKVRGKSAEEIREVFLSKPEIESLDVEFFPFWVKTAPSLSGRIRLDVQ